VKLTQREETLLRHTFLDYRQTKDFLESPLIISRAEGMSYWDRDGKRYVDGIGGIFVAGLGHRHPRVMDAVRAQMDRLTFAPPLHGIADITLDLVEKLGSVAPEGMTYVKPFSGGSESVEAALKFVRQYWKQSGCPGKYKFVGRYHGFHGGTFGAMGASGTGKRKTSFEPQMPGFLKVWPPTHFRGTFADWDECNRFAARQFEDIIVSEDPDTVAGVIVEPIGNTGGIITPTPEYYRILRDICDRHHVRTMRCDVCSPGFRHHA
jgi:adenosylmethionine-8-amino-7-oxononanoate aminotransferase